MALNYISIDPINGAEILNLLKRMSSDLAQLKVIYRSMQDKIDGDGSSDTHFTLMTATYGYLNNTDAHRSFGEIGATIGGSGELEQCAAYHRQV